MNTLGDNDKEDLYALLNLSHSATATDIQRSYKRLSRVFHPDKSPSKIVDAQKTFVAIKQAHDVLVDPILRMAYEYGGLRLVALIKRSQASSNNGSSSDLYKELQKAKTKEDAVSLLQQIVDQDKWTRQSTEHATAELSTNVTFPYEYNNQHKAELTSTAVQFQSRLRKGDEWSCTIGGNASMQRTGMADTSTSLSADYQPQRGTHVTMDSSFRPGQPFPNVALRSSRQMADGTFVVAGLGGNLQSRQTWTYSIVSYRNLLWDSGNAEEPPRKLQASWRLSFKPWLGEFQQALATIKTREFPQWRCSTGLGTFPLKISYQSAEVDTPYIAYSWGVTFSKLKVAWIQQLGGDHGDWTLKYGVKFDGRAFYQPGALSLWTFVFQLHSSIWTIRLPISLFPRNVWPVASILTLLVSQWCDRFLENFWAKSELSMESSNVTDGGDQAKTGELVAPFTQFSGVIGMVAAKKRRAEENLVEGGLVILSAWWEIPTGASFGSDSTIDVTSFLQFWVVDSTLLIPMAEVTKWLPKVGADHEQDVASNTWNQIWRAIRQITKQSEQNKGHAREKKHALRIRYVFQHKVYDIQFAEDKDQKVYLPNDERASELGPANRLQ
ncbi:hypothetical protein FisN_22Lh265 [Fistulifera solaris]|uniref:J domain-containing protein n=1 Tax=Fistulifera solaris TaxID=1519565 RepID=A0A1Z5JC31_FISSO|nr:hypothetical protein FisN_22Lh265 [Fistulifera solaris]|eukprot:GAX11570.1 hypothetical protein FisN_22Lh265 [Fistulifera solaris]